MNNRLWHESDLVKDINDAWCVTLYTPWRYSRQHTGISPSNLLLVNANKLKKVIEKDGLDSIIYFKIRFDDPEANIYVFEDRKITVGKLLLLLKQKKALMRKIWNGDTVINFSRLDCDLVEEQSLMIKCSIKKA
jgi:hypothetical protein